MVLLAFTKEPFGPLSKATLKLLTYKTVFLLALASGKCRSELHAWLFSSAFFNHDNSQVTLAPSPNFWQKNQLASSGPGAIKPVVISALTKVLDSSLAADRTLCPVRALRYYIDRTKKLVCVCTLVWWPKFIFASLWQMLL